MRPRFLIVGAALAIMATSCARLPTSSSSEQTTDRQSTQRRDSTATETTYRERIRLTPVEVAADTLGFQTQLEVLPTGQLKPTTYTSRGRRATVQLKVDAQGKVTGRCGCDAEKATIASLDRELSQAHTQKQQQADTKYITHTIRKTVAVPTPYTAWYDWLARVVAIGLLLLLLVLYIIHRFSRKADE
jgi:hypothetical protein